MRWRDPHTTTGFASHGALLMIMLLGFGWLGWPVWSSLTAPDRETVTALTGHLLGALTGLLVLLAWTIWRDTHHRTGVFAPIVFVTALGAIVRITLQPGSSGFEPALALPLILGAALGAPAGFLTGAVTALGSSVALGLVDTPLVGQALVWGLWGAVGGLVKSWQPIAAWLGAILACIPLGLLSGLMLNAIGWAGERGVSDGAFLPGLPPSETAMRLWEYTLATSVALDSIRAVTAAITVAIIGLPLLRALRTASGTAPAPPIPIDANTTPRVAPSALEHRRRSRQLDRLWTTNERTP